MKKEIWGIRTNYIFNYIEKDTTIVFLHGWGQNIEMMKPLDVYEYIDYLKELFECLGLNKIIIVGHSLGGRLGIVYSSKYC